MQVTVLPQGKARGLEGKHKRLDAKGKGGTRGRYHTPIRNRDKYEMWLASLMDKSTV